MPQPVPHSTPRFVPHRSSAAPPIVDGYDPELAAVNTLIWSPGLAERAAADLDPRWFTDPWCRAVAATVVALVHDREPVTARTIHARLVDAGVHRPHDSWQLMLAAVTAPMSEYPTHLALVIDKHRRRCVQQALIAALESLAAGAPVDPVTTRLEERLHTIRGS